MAKEIILDKIKYLRVLLEDAEIAAEEMLEIEAVLREIEEEARK